MSNGDDFNGFINPKDPLKHHQADGQRELFVKLRQQATGHPMDHVIGAAINLLVNGLRQAYGSRNQAEQRFDELSARAKALLMDHYDTMGRRKNIFPFQQTIRPELFVDPDFIQGKKAN